MVSAIRPGTISNGSGEAASKTFNVQLSDGNPPEPWLQLGTMRSMHRQGLRSIGTRII